MLLKTRMKMELLVLGLLLAVLTGKCHSVVYLPSILWDPRNYLFGCANLTIKVHPSDSISIVCPNRNLNYGQLGNNADQVFERIHLLSHQYKTNYDTCNLTGLTRPKDQFEVFLECNVGSEFKSESLIFDPNRNGRNPSFPQFLAGQTYYLLSTSERTFAKLAQKVNGSCQGNVKQGYFPLKLQFYICTPKEIRDGQCDLCETASCYEEGCGKMSEWRPSPNDFSWNGSRCLQKEKRKCDSKYFQCAGELVTRLEKVVPANSCKLPDCPSVTPSYPRLSPTPSTFFVTTTVTSSVTITTTVATVMMSVTTVTKATHTKTVTKTVTHTQVTETCTAKKEYVDIEYDKKFYITVCAAIIGAMLVGIFVAHACVTYYSATRKRKHVYIRQKLDDSEVDHLTHTEESYASRETTEIYQT